MSQATSACARARSAAPPLGKVASLSLVDQVEAEWLPLLGLVYDPKDDLVEVALDGVDHMIPKPREIYVDDGLGGLMSIEVVDAEGTKQIIIFRDPMMLPPPAN
jgi:Family of unknown function (DUF5335)